MKKKIVLLTICLLLVGAFVFSACSEKTSQKPIETNLSEATLSDNGGMAVRYGDYVYFINGFAGETASNAFGEVVRGAICRTTLKNGVPDYKSVEIIVPKNVFGEDKTYGGIYIVNNYIYYNTPSVDKDSNRDYKYDEGVLMRTSIDGSKTEVVKEFDDNDVVLYAGDNSKYLAYIYDNYAYLVNSSDNAVTLLSKANGKNPTDEKQSVVSYKFSGDYLVYTMYNYADEANYSADYIVWLCNLKTGKQFEIMSSDKYNGNKDRTVLYTTTVTDVVPTADGCVVYYSKKGNGNTQNDGFYSCAFDANNPQFDKNKEVRYTYETDTYTKFTRLENGYTLAFNSKLFDVFTETGDKATDADGKYLRLNFEKEVTIIDVAETADEVYAYYLLDSKFYYIKLFDKNNSTITPASANAVAFFSGKYNSSYTSYDFIGNVIYYFNDDMEDNAYYYVVPAFDTITSATDKSSGKILGIISETDMITLIGEEKEETSAS